MKKAFTLIELIIVGAVIAILIGIALPRFRGMREEGNIAKAKGELRTLQTAVESYYIHRGNVYPLTLADLPGQRPQIVSEVFDDPFATAGTDYGYARGGANNGFYVIYSVGPAGNGSAVIVTMVIINGDPVIVRNTVFETNGTSCIYVSNTGQRDTTP